ncbi:MAG: hypothetical protein HQL11_00895 [Candidatus Omnitrophica bacterium]|nr:hypothetical protein [Candidatus Omnitrophota bacterium]
MSYLWRNFLKMIFRPPFLRAVAVYLAARVFKRGRGISDSFSERLPYPVMFKCPWARNSTPLERSSVAIVSVAGLFVKGQPPFDRHGLWGDFGYRVIHRDIPSQRYTAGDPTLDARLALLDQNMLCPVERLVELSHRGVIREAARQHYSFAAFSARLGRVMDGSAKDVSRRLRYEGVDKAVILPGSVLAQTVAGLVQRAIEEEGIPTVSLLYSPEAVRCLNPPRACLLAEGSLSKLEALLDPSAQLKLLRALLDRFDAARSPGDFVRVFVDSESRPAPPSGRQPRSRDQVRMSSQGDLFQ